MSLGIIAILNLVWFSPFDFRTIMGDDLIIWSIYAANPSYESLIFEGVQGKYRPILSAVQLVLFDVLSSDYRTWFSFNLLLNLVIASLLFGLVRKLTRHDNLIALLATIAFVTSRFSYYNVLQLFGVMEALCLLFLILIIWTAVVFLRKRLVWPGYMLAGLYLVITLTHERYLVLLPFLLLVVVLKRHVSILTRALLVTAMAGPVLVNALAKVLMDVEVLMGTGGVSLSVAPLQVLELLIKGFANMLWINAGPQYLSGIPWNSVGGGARLLVGFVVTGVAVVVIASAVRVVRSRRRGVQVAELRTFLLFATLFGALLVAASITFRQEFRWLYAPFMVCLIYFSYLVSRIHLRDSLKYAGLLVMMLGIFGLDIYYQRHVTNVHFISGQIHADSLYDLTIGRYGAAMRDYTVYIADEQPAELKWFFGDRFLAPYLGLDYRRIEFIPNARDVAAIPGLDAGGTLVFERDWATKSFVDVTEAALGEDRD